VPQDLTHTNWTRALAFAAAALFAASWFLPVLADMPGWMAFRYALAPLIPFRDRDGSSVGWEDSVPQLLSALTNVVFVILFALWATRQSPRPGLFVRENSGRVLANLHSDDGEYMRCRFKLLSPDRGMKGGGEGRCQLSESRREINAEFDRQS